VLGRRHFLELRKLFLRWEPFDVESQVVAEASDGLEAVQRAEELKPDLILLDIGLPNLNGIEVESRAWRRCSAATVHNHLLPCRRLRSLRRIKRDADMDGRATHWLRFDGNRPIDQSRPFPHAGEPQTLAQHRWFEVKSPA